MLTTFGRSVAGLAAGMILGSQTLAQTQAADPRAFTATAVQTLPDGTEQVGMIAKSGKNMRMESVVNGQKAIQIMRGEEGLAYFLDPQALTFFVVNDPSVTEAVAGASDPCPPQAQAQAMQIRCIQNGTDKVSGVTVQRYEIQGPQDQAPSVVLWDPGRRRSLGQTWPDGSSLTMAFQAMETIDGREVEHWTSSFQAQGQPAAMGDWWFDSNLIVVVREDLPGGISRRLTNIYAGPVDPAMFLPPQGWTQVQPPQQQTGQ
jgi:hypothetical protein